MDKKTGYSDCCSLKCLPARPTGRA